MALPETLAALTALGLLAYLVPRCCGPRNSRTCLMTFPAGA
jgi:hypothetical protein